MRRIGLIYGLIIPVLATTPLLLTGCDANSGYGNMQPVTALQSLDQNINRSTNQNIN